MAGKAKPNTRPTGQTNKKTCLSQHDGEQNTSHGDAHHEGRENQPRGENVVLENALQGRHPHKHCAWARKSIGRGEGGGLVARLRHPRSEEANYKTLELRNSQPSSGVCLRSIHRPPVVHLVECTTQVNIPPLPPPRFNHGVSLAPGKQSRNSRRRQPSFSSLFSFLSHRT